MFYGERIFASKYKGVPDFMKVAEGFGWQTLDLDQADDPVAALGQALTTRGPTLIHASIDMREQVLPMVAPGAANKDMIGG
jgi:acetolactate synthase-1/2/3 large subunit